MTEFVPIESFSTFHVPEFEIALGDGEANDVLRFDVLDVTYSDAPDAFDSFSISLRDWDDRRLEPMYSSPWDEKGEQKTCPGSDMLIPVLEPGTVMSLSLYYRDSYEEGRALMEPHLMLRGHVASVSTSFPASGPPVAKVRVLSPLAWLGRKKLKGKASGGLIDLIVAVCEQIELDVDLSGVPAEILATERGLKKPSHDIEQKDANQVLKDAITRLGLGSSVEYDSSNRRERLVLGRRSGLNLSLTWGRTLISFSPTVTTSGLAKSVRITREDLLGNSEEAQRRDVERSWADLSSLDRNVLGPGVLDKILDALPDEPEPITDPTQYQMMYPEQAVLNRLREMAMGLITGSGHTVGLPQLRKGARVKLLGLGAKFSGVYEVTRSTHTIGRAGYTTSFDARKEVLLDA